MKNWNHFGVIYGAIRNHMMKKQDDWKYKRQS